MIKQKNPPSDLILAHLYFISIKLFSAFFFWHRSTNIAICCTFSRSTEGKKLLSWDKSIFSQSLSLFYHFSKFGAIFFVLFISASSVTYAYVSHTCAAKSFNLCSKSIFLPSNNKWHNKINTTTHQMTQFI